MRKPSLTLIYAMLGGSVLMCLSACEGLMERTFIFFPAAQLETTPLHVGLKFQECFFYTEDGLQLHGWYVPAGGGAPVIMWLHGNGGNISHRVENIALWHQSGFGVWIFDYRGYGLSQGRPSETGVYADARAAYRHLVESLGVPPERVVIFGRSLGCAVAVELANGVPARALILESAFTNVGDMARYHYAWLPGKGLWAKKFDSTGRLSGLTLPKLFIHGEKDDIVPLWMGKRLYNLAPPPKEFYLIAGAGHNDTYQVGGPAYFDRLRSFIEPAS